LLGNGLALGAGAPAVALQTRDLLGELLADTSTAKADEELVMLGILGHAAGLPFAARN
jgi:hypothetical protein